MNDIAIDMGMDPETAALLREVSTRKEAAVANEDFELAKRMKGLQDQIKHVGGTLATLVADKNRAIAEEDYDRARKVKEDITHIRETISKQLTDLGFGTQSRGSAGGGAMGNTLAAATSRGPPPRTLIAGVNDNSMYGNETQISHVFPSSVEIGAGAGSGGGDRSVERPIRPAPGAFGSPPRSMGEEEDAGGARMSSSPSGRPQSRQIRPAREHALESAMATEGAGDGPSSPFGSRAGVMSDRGGGGGGGGGMAQAGSAGGAADPSALAGVEGAEDLPAPDPLSATGEKEAGHLIDVFGMYLVRCFCSRAWSLREAAVIKMGIELPRLVSQAKLSRVEALQLASTVVADIALRERIAHVFTAGAARFLPAAIQTAAESGGAGGPAARRNDFAHALDPVATAFVDKLGDNTPKVREAAISGLIDIAAQGILGAASVSSFLMRRPGKKQATNTIGLQSRLEVLTLLIEQRGLLVPSSGVTADALVAFCQEHGTFAHANGDIRHSTLELMTAAYKAVGRSLQNLITPILRPKQRQEYEAAFAAATDGIPPPSLQVAAPQSNNSARAPSKAATKAPAASKAQPGKPPVASPAPQGGGGAGRGMPPVTEAPSEQHEHGEDEDDVPPGVCQFCGGCGEGTTSAQLDLHYWQDCPLLMACPRCQMIIEISSLAEHLVDECDHKADYEACTTCAQVRRIYHQSPSMTFETQSSTRPPPPPLLRPSFELNTKPMCAMPSVFPSSNPLQRLRLGALSALMTSPQRRMAGSCTLLGPSRVGKIQEILPLLRRRRRKWLNSS
jgi:centrosomal protein CEP104